MFCCGFLFFRELVAAKVQRKKGPVNSKHRFLWRKKLPAFWILYSLHSQPSRWQNRKLTKRKENKWRVRGFFNTRIGIQIKHTVGFEDEINYLGSSCLASCKGIMVLAGHFMPHFDYLPKMNTEIISISHFHVNWPCK